MTEQQSVWRCTGLHWESETPVLTAAVAPADPSSARRRQQGEHRRVISLSFPIAWCLSGPRRCTGVWNGTTRTPCPHRAILDDGLDPLCDGCAAADRGRAIARNAVVDDGRSYALYLAWFGPGLIKVGLTAAERGRDRLLEQGAIAYTLLATGPYGPIRQAERLISTAGLATERVSARVKADAWWKVPPETERARGLGTAAQIIAEQLTLPDDIQPLPCAVVDQAADFGLVKSPPDSYAEISGVGDGTQFAGEIRLIVGRRLLLHTDTGPLLVDMRRIAGWGLTNLAMPTTAHVQTVARKRPRDHDADQEALF